MIFALFIEYPATGYIKVETFDDVSVRGFYMITLRNQPVILSTRDYPDPARHG